MDVERLIITCFDELVEATSASCVDAVELTFRSEEVYCGDLGKAIFRSSRSIGTGMGGHDLLAWLDGGLADIQLRRSKYIALRVLKFESCGAEEERV